MFGWEKVFQFLSDTLYKQPYFLGSAVKQNAAQPNVALGVLCIVYHFSVTSNNTRGVRKQRENRSRDGVSVELNLGSKTLSVAAVFGWLLEGNLSWVTFLMRTTCAQLLIIRIYNPSIYLSIQLLLLLLMLSNPEPRDVEAEPWW